MNQEQKQALELLAEALRAHPDLRVCQLLVNLLGTDPYYVKDERLVEKLKSLIVKGWAGV